MCFTRQFHGKRLVFRPTLPLPCRETPPFLQVDPGGKQTPTKWNCTVSYETRQFKKIFLKLRD